MHETIGFWKGLGMAWTAAIGAIVQMFQAAETTAKGVKGVAESFEESTQVLKANVKSWTDQDKALQDMKAAKPVVPA
jgi:uncharacterized membrane protein